MVDGRRPLGQPMIRHLYVHIPFCARICPYCAFYKDLLDRSQTGRFCEAILQELGRAKVDRLVPKPMKRGPVNALGTTRSTFISNPASRITYSIVPQTIYFGGGTPTALNIAQLELLLRGFHERLDLSELVEWTMEANPGSVSARKAAVLKKFGVNRISLGVQSWDNDLLKLLEREHDVRQAEESFRILRKAEFTNINVDFMFALPGQTAKQWRATLEKTISLEPEHISTYCLTYEEDTQFFLRHARGEFRADPDLEAEFFETTISMLGAAGYEQYEISNYARRGFESAHNRAYWSGEDYLGIGPSAFSTVGMRRWQNVCDYREYIERALSNRSPIQSVEELKPSMKRAEKIALGLRTAQGVSASLLERDQAAEFVQLGLLQRRNGYFILTRAGKCLADSVAEAFV